MENFCLHESNKKLFYEQLKSLLSTHPKLSITAKPYRPKRSLSQNSLSHVWYKEISEYLIRAGRPFCTEAWVKRSLKATYLGFETTEYTDVITGEKTQRETLRRTSKLDKGDMHYFLQQIESWAAQFGLILTTPEDSEYMKLKREQDA
ncbi:recombination protein NinB [Morganella morganii]|uniref:recombination protein NinB n=1 Tax=Morganella morganii TaxID=582 RepID=UPI001BDA17D8|nr:recombination protein NinB [Morganella morganii subsp. morganii]QWM12315.1 recombination protein NinB [Morganella morganii subsp. morganii]